jgi:hypothetical protein
MGSKNHEVVPTSLVAQISGLRSGGVNKYLGSLAKRNLVSKVQNAKCRFDILHHITFVVSLPKKMTGTGLHMAVMIILLCVLCPSVAPFSQ